MEGAAYKLWNRIKQSISTALLTDALIASRKRALVSIMMRNQRSLLVEKCYMLVIRAACCIVYAWKRTSEYCL